MVAPMPVNVLSNCDECHSKRCPFCSRCHANTICPVSIPPCAESVAQGLFVAWSYEPGSALSLSYCEHHKTHTCPNKLCPKHDSYSCGCYACDGSPYRQQTLEQQRVKILSFEVATAIDLFPHTMTAGMARFGDRREHVLKEGETWGLRPGFTYVHPAIVFCMVTGDASPETANAVEAFLRQHSWESHVKVTEENFSLDYQYYDNQPFRMFLRENGHLEKKG